MLRIVMLSLAAIIMVAQSASAFDGLNMNMGTLSLLSDAKTRSISPENFSGQKGSGAMADPAKYVRNVSNASHKAKELGKGWR